MSNTFITTSSVEFAHEPLLIVQRIVTAVPTTRPVIVVLAVVALVIVAVPETMLQVPVPSPGVFPVNVVDVWLQIF